MSFGQAAGKLGLAALAGLCLLAALAVALSGCEPPGPPRPWMPPRPRPPHNPAPAPSPKPCPDRGPCPRGGSKDGERVAFTGAVVGGFTTPDGRPCQCEIPGNLWRENQQGSDGAGLCVYASAYHSGLHNDLAPFVGLFDWMTKRPGGSYPEKFDKDMAAFCKAQGKAVPPYLHYVGSDLSVIEEACAQGLMVGTTYNYSPTGRYGGRPTSHMVNTIHADGTWYGVMDNNYPNSVEWMDKKTYKDVTAGGSRLWALIPLSPGLPPSPHNPKGD